MSDGDGDGAACTWATVDGVVAASHGPGVIDAKAHAGGGRARLRVRPDDRPESSLTGVVDLEPHDIRTLADAVDPEEPRRGACVPATHVVDGAGTWVSVFPVGGRLRVSLGSAQGVAMIDADDSDSRHAVVDTLRDAADAREEIDS